MLNRRRLPLSACAGLIVLGVLTSACSSPAPTSPPAPAFWGEMNPTVSVKELMGNLIDPASDYIFDAVGSEMTATGTRDWAPVTDEDWAKVRMGAVTMAEGALLLRIPRPFAPPGDENDSIGPDAPELSPTAIRAKLDADPVLWEAKVQALQNVGREVLAIVDKRDVVELFNAGEDLDNACETCHLEYWYPGQLEFLKKLDQRLLELYGPGANPTPPAR